MRQVLHVHELLTSVVSPAKWIAEARRRIDDAIEKPLEETELGKDLLRVIGRGLESILSRTDKAIQTVSESGISKYVEYLREMSTVFGYWNDVFQGGGIDALAEVVKDPQWPKLPAVRSEVPGKELGKSLIDGLKKDATSGGWRDMLRFSTQEWRDGLKKVRPHAGVFLELVEQFGEKVWPGQTQLRGCPLSSQAVYPCGIVR